MPSLDCVASWAGCYTYTLTTTNNGDCTRFCFASTLATSSDGPPALVAHSPVGGLLSCFRSGETQSRRGTHSSDSVHSANPEECGAGVTHPDTAHEMRIPLRPLRMSKSYRRLRKRHLRLESVKSLLELSVPTVSPNCVI